eukprot:g17077.t1
MENVSALLCNVADAAELTRNVHPDPKWHDGANEAVNEISQYMSVVNLDESVFEMLRRHDEADAAGEGGHGGRLPAAERGKASLKTVEEKKIFKHMLDSMANEGVGMEEKQQCLELQQYEQELAFQLAGAAAGGEDIEDEQQAPVKGSSGHGGESEVSGSRRTSDDVWLPVTEDIKPFLQYLPQRRAPGASLYERARGTAAGSTKAFEVNVAGKNQPSYIADALLKHCQNPAARKKIFELQSRESPSMEQALVELLNCRTALAQLRKYENWNDYAQRDSVLATAVSTVNGGTGGTSLSTEAPLQLSSQEKVLSFLEKAWRALLPGLLKELEILARMKSSDEEKKNKNISITTLNAWDVPYYSERTRHAQEAFLTFDSLINGMNLILNEFLGLKFSEVAPEQGEVWHPSVRKFTLEVLERAKKEKGSEEEPLLGILTEFQSLSGTRGAVDFVEFPSHLFEYFVMDPEVLARYSSDASSSSSKTRKIDAFRKHRHEFAHLEACQQLLFALVDQQFYASLPSSSEATTSEGNGAAGGVISVEDMRRSVQQGVLERLPDLSKEVRYVTNVGEVANGIGDGELQLVDSESDISAMCGRGPPGTEESSTLRDILTPMALSRFEHLIHYGGSYYCYLLNKVLSAHVWRAAGFCELQNGERLRKFMEHGSVHAHIGSILDLVKNNNKTKNTQGGTGGTPSSQAFDIDLFLKSYVSELAS